VAVLLVAPLLVVATPAGAAAADHSRVVRVSTAAELAAAMAAAQPGDTIRMADGEYRGEAFTTVSGTPSRPITLVGSRRAVIVNDWFEQPTTPCPSGHTGYGVWLDGASHWRLHGFTVADSKKGIVVDRVVRLGWARGTVSDELVTVEVPVDPAAGRTTFGTAEHGAVERACRVEIVDWDGEVEARSHTPIVPRAARRKPRPGGALAAT